MDGVQHDCGAARSTWSQMHGPQSERVANDADRREGHGCRRSDHGAGSRARGRDSRQTRDESRRKTHDVQDRSSGDVAAAVSEVKITLRKALS